MPTILDCSSCGAPLPADRRCCPHCHCKNAAWKKWALAAAAAAGLGAADCGGTHEPVVEYGPAPFGDFAGVDESVPQDLATHDLVAMPDGGDAGTK